MEANFFLPSANGWCTPQTFFLLIVIFITAPLCTAFLFPAHLFAF